MASLLRRITSFSDVIRIKKLAQAQTAHSCSKNQTGDDCTRLLYLNLSAGQSEKHESVLGKGELVLTVKIAGAPLRRMIV